MPRERLVTRTQRTRRTRRTRGATVAGRLVLLLAAASLAGAGPLGAQRLTRYDATFRKYSKRYFGIAFDWRYFKAQAMAESDLDPAARSPVGARGLMQLMPSTFQAIQTKRPEFQSIDDPVWNIAAGILHDRGLWKRWEDRVPAAERLPFMFGAYNAGEGPITRASAAARAQQLEPARWASIEVVAPTVPRWRYRETLGYVRKIDAHYSSLRNPR